ncbi:hypothetical protein GQX73_g3332 [Xylaria multiplex]|uniref:Uncharacterized protein n=1 Tax=Xylaria multiplex TaxID=323545 RepID=A0A7C8ISW6_9PEZI|nr:hypothetical protein GQX73_g3332 [Xylaria multiplex]
MLRDLTVRRSTVQEDSPECTGGVCTRELTKACLPRGIQLGPAPRLGPQPHLVATNRSASTSARPTLPTHTLQRWRWTRWTALTPSRRDWPRSIKPAGCQSTPVVLNASRCMPSSRAYHTNHWQTARTRLRQTSRHLSSLRLQTCPAQLWAVTRILFTYHFEKTFGVLLADGMGAGKTFESSCGIILTSYIHLAAQDDKVTTLNVPRERLSEATPVPASSDRAGYATPTVPATTTYTKST